MDTPQRHPLPMGATPYEGFDRVEVVDARELMTEPQDMGDALALDRAILEAAPQSYRYRWNAFLGSPEAA